MNTKKNKRLDAYRPVLNKLETEDGVQYVAEFREFEFCSGGGNTPEEAISEAKKNLAIYIEELKAEGKPVPAPLKDDTKETATE